VFVRIRVWRALSKGSQPMLTLASPKSHHETHEIKQVYADKHQRA